MAGINLASDVYRLKRENNARRQNAVTFSCLGKLKSTNSYDLLRWKSCLQTLLGEILNGKEGSHRPLVIGLTESGIIPSGLIHLLLREQGIPAHWVCSTRRPSGGIHFTESHSHGPDHILPLPRYRPGELWFVEDEITTGRTVLRLALILCRIMEVRRIRFLAIADTRSTEHRKEFRSALRDHGIRHSVHALMRLRKTDGDEADSHHPLLEQEFTEDRISESNEDFGIGRHFPRERPALRNQLDVVLPFSTNLRGSLLVIGEAVDLAFHLVRMNPRLSFRHVTMSPWKVDGKNIFDRLDILGKYYLYNYRSLRPPLYLLDDPIDHEIGREVTRLLSEKGFWVRPLFEDCEIELHREAQRGFNPVLQFS